MGNRSNHALTDEQVREQLETYYPYLKRSASFRFGFIENGVFDYEDLLHQACEDVLLHGCGSSTVVSTTVQLNMRLLGSSTYRHKRVVYGEQQPQESLDALMEDVFEDEPSDDPFYRIEETRDLEKAINSLLPREAHLIRLYQLGYSDSDIAGVMGCSRQRVDKIKQRSIAKLAAFYGGSND